MELGNGPILTIELVLEVGNRLAVPHVRMEQPLCDPRVATMERHVGGGGVGFEWNVVRVIISAGATLLARPLCTSTDPMSGFFCTSKQVLAKGEPRPLGFKVGLEVMVRCRCTAVEDVPITFRERTAGESKLSAKQNVEYLQQLAGLYWFARRYEVLALLFVLVVLVAYVASLVF